MVLVDISFLVAFAFINYCETSNSRILKIENILSYKKEIELYWDEKNINAKFDREFSTVFRKYKRFFEFIPGDNVIIFHGNVDLDTLKDTFTGMIDSKIEQAFFDEKLKYRLFS